MFPFFVSSKSGLKVVHPLKIYQNKISWPYVDWCKLYIHLKSLSVRHFGMLAY